jgi:glycosyltransferase involved in cell wall biosynthesis|tara:strand:- start:1696 stop:2835 length:1140 start_codon:yes stop_codon:yes gene_type:complete
MGGTEISALKIARALSLRHRVLIFDQYPDYSKNSVLKAHFPDAEVISISNSWMIRRLIWKLNACFHYIGLGNRFYDLVNAICLFWIIHRYSIEVVNTHVYHFDSAICHVPYSGRTRYIVTIHSSYQYMIDKHGFDALKEHFYSNLPSIHGVIYKTNLGISFKKYIPDNIYNHILFRKIHNAVVPSTIIEKSESISGAFVVGMVGRGSREKGWKEAIEAYLLTRDEVNNGLSLMLIGDGDYLRRLKRKYSCYTDISFIGNVKNPSKYIARFDVGLLPSYTEAFPNVLLEYIHCNKPSVATDVGEVRRILNIKGHSCGQVIPLGKSSTPDPREIAKALRRYIKDSQLYDCHKRNTKYAAERFSLESCISEYDAFFRRVLND